MAVTAGRYVWAAGGAGGAHVGDGGSGCLGRRWRRWRVGTVTAGRDGRHHLGIGIGGGVGPAGALPRKRSAGGFRLRELKSAGRSAPFEGAGVRRGSPRDLPADTPGRHEVRRAEAVMAVGGTDQGGSAHEQCVCHHSGANPPENTVPAPKSHPPDQTPFARTPDQRPTSPPTSRTRRESYPPDQRRIAPKPTAPAQAVESNAYVPLTVSTSSEGCSRSWSTSWSAATSRRASASGSPVPVLRA